MATVTTARFLRLAQWFIPLGSSLVLGLSISDPAEAAIEQIYTLPFYDSYNLSCGFHCYYDPVYGWHEGVDYEVGTPGTGGERVAAAAPGTAENCGLSETAGNYIVLDHGNGHRTRYLHLNTEALPADGAKVARGQVIGYEGNTGYTDPPGFYHLHFETRHGATTFTCGYDGTAVDPYAGSTYMWTTNEPSYQDQHGPCPGAVSWGPGRVDTFAREPARQLKQVWWAGSGWTWTQIPGADIASGPGAASLAPGRLDTFARGFDNHVWQAWWQGTGWNWADLTNAAQPAGYTITSAPGAVSWDASRVDVFARRANGHLWQLWWTGGPWNWADLGSPVAPSAPAAASWAPGRLDVFVRGSDGHLWQVWWQGAGWNWTDLTLQGQPPGLTITSSPGAVSWDYGRIDVFLRSSDNHLWQVWWQGAGWNWTDLTLQGQPSGVTLTSAPSAASWGFGRLDVFVRGSDSQLWQVWWQGAGWNWTPISGGSLGPGC